MKKDLYPSPRSAAIGFVGRMRSYTSEMLPFPRHFAMSAFLYAAVVTFLERLHGTGSSLGSPYAIAGIGSVFAVMLILRLMDELKDLEIDRELFADRPLPSGMVLESDIVVSLVVTVGLLLFVNLWSGPAFWMVLITLGYALLMFRYFFIPRVLRRYLLLNLATHTPIVPIMLLYLVALFAVVHDLRPVDLDPVACGLVITVFWALFLSWEIARKIRSPEEENDYVTYSRILGRAGAVCLAGAVQGVVLAVGLYLYRVQALSAFFPIAVALGYSGVLCAYARFLSHPVPRTSKLKPVAECYIFIVLAGAVVENVFFS